MGQQSSADRNGGRARDAWEEQRPVEGNGAQVVLAKNTIRKNIF
jgi:hypothetical protein